MEAEGERYTITELAREFGVTSRTIRFYEAEGLLAPERRGTTRLYGKADRARLAWVFRGRAVGFSLADIRELLDLYTPGSDNRAQREAALAKTEQRLAALRAQRDAIDSTVTELEQFAATLRSRL